MNRFDTLYIIILLQCIAACKNNSSPIYQNDCPDYYPVTLYERLYELASKNQEQSLVDSILQIDPFSVDLIRFKIQLYHDRKQPDSIDNYLNQLTTDYPDRPEAWLRKGKFRYGMPWQIDTNRIICYLKAWQLDPNHEETNTLLSEVYYKWHLENPEYYRAFEARKFLINNYSLNPSKYFLLQYPILQLSHYLKDTSFIESLQGNFTKNLSHNNKNVPYSTWYFPAGSFLELDSHWVSNYSSDMLNKIEYEKFVQDWYAQELHFFQENALFPPEDNYTYRFTCLRTFHPPYVITLEKKKKHLELRWKLGGFDYEKCRRIILVNSNKPISNSFFENFEKGLQKVDFWNLPIRDTTISQGTDGDRWIFEAAVQGKYHVVDRWSPYGTPFALLLTSLFAETDLSKYDED